MVIEQFPPVEEADDETGLLAIGGDLEVESLVLAYRSGIFPWPVDEELLTWFAPKKRAVLFFDDFHVSRSLIRFRKTKEYEFKLNTRFEDVINLCAEVVNRGDQRGTWITQEMIPAYIEFHKAGYAHSGEIYYEGELAGGIYGVRIGNMFAGESMFYRQSNASKLALVHLIEWLQVQGITWMDCQNLTPLLEGFGAVEIERGRFMEMLGECIGTE